MKFEIFSRSFATKKIIVFIFLSIILFVSVYLEDKGEGSIFTKILMGIAVISFIIPHITKPKIIGEIIFNDNSVSIIKKGKERIIKFSNINYIEINYCNYYNETTLNAGKIVFENGAANSIFIKTRNEQIKFNFFSRNGEESNLIKNYLSILNNNNISYEVKVKKEIFSYDAV